MIGQLLRDGLALVAEGASLAWEHPLRALGVFAVWMALSIAGAIGFGRAVAEVQYDETEHGVHRVRAVR